MSYKCLWCTCSLTRISNGYSNTQCPAPPPVNVEATQASASAPVEVSWSPPSDGPTDITAYRIFYGNGENEFVSSTVTGIILSLNEDSVGWTVSIRSEADQLTSQLINVTVTGQLSLKSTL